MLQIRLLTWHFYLTLLWYGTAEMNEYLGIEDVSAIFGILVDNKNSLNSLTVILESFLYDWICIDSSFLSFY